MLSVHGLLRIVKFIDKQPIKGNPGCYNLYFDAVSGRKKFNLEAQQEVYRIQVWVNENTEKKLDYWRSILKPGVLIDVRWGQVQGSPYKPESGQADPISNFRGQIKLRLHTDHIVFVEGN